MKKFVFNQVPCLQSVTLLKIKSFSKYFLKVFFMDIRTIFLQQIYLLTYYLPLYLPTNQLTGRPPNRLTDRPTDRPADWLTDRPTDQSTDQSISRSIHLSINIHLYTYIHFFFHSWFHCWQKHEKEEHVVAWKIWFHSFERQKHETKNDISSRKTCHNTIWTLVKLASIF